MKRLAWTITIIFALVTLPLTLSFLLYRYAWSLSEGIAEWMYEATA